MLCVERVGDLQVGDMGFTSITGRVGAAVLVGQTAIDVCALLRGRRVENAGWLTHAYIVTQTGRHGLAGEPWVAVVEAMPAGARRVVLTGTERVGPGYAYVRLPDSAGPSGWQGAAVDAAEQMIGTPYGFVQYAAIAGLTLFGGPTVDRRTAVARYVNRRNPRTGRPEQVICSQLVDEALRRGGVKLFDDGRPPQYVTPGALFWRTARLGEVCV